MSEEVLSRGNRLLGLTEKQKKFADAFVRTGSKAEAVRTAYGDKNMSHHSAASLAYFTLRKQHVLDYITKEFLRLNAPQKATNKLVEKLEAKTTLFIPGKGEVEVDAHGIQLKAAVEILKVLGAHDPPVVGDVEIDESHLHLHFEVEPREVLEFISEHGRYPTDDECKTIDIEARPVDDEAGASQASG